MAVGRLLYLPMMVARWLWLVVVARLRSSMEILGKQGKKVA